ncbi:MAG: hypothetical protein HFH51_05455 [Lachnospiraceae bacterium]|nr:hypothetical protein [Lachnospiraceae bacterium]
MIPLQIEEKLQMFQCEKYVVLREKEQKELVEKSRSGKVKLTFTALGDTLLLLSPECNVLPYLDEKQKGATSCADIFIYRRRDEGTWDLHVIEFKKTINTASLGKSRWQFIMGIYNARAVAAFLGMELENIYLYSGYRKDTLADMEHASLIALRASNNSSALKEIKQWNSGRCELILDGNSRVLALQKIQLDQDGEGSLSI